MNQSTIAQGGGIANVPFLHENVFYSSVYINFGADSIHEEGSGKSAASSSTASQTGDSVHAVPADDQKCRAHLMSMLKETYERILIGNSQTGHTKFLEDIYSELTVVQNESGGVINEHEVMQIDLSSIRPLDEDIFIKCNDIFKVQPHTERRNRKVLTMGIAGVGKTVSVNKFILDWAKGKENQDIHFIFPLPFRVLNLKKAKKFSLIDLLNHYFFSSKPQLKSLPEDDGKVLFIFDGLDECHFPLYFEDEEEVKDVNEKASVGSLITSLINRNLLPFALIWVTSRPAAAHLMPREYINLVTEVRGFSDEQKEAYFTKYCNEDVAMKIFSHIKKSVSLYIMCQIPVFCWISATVLQPLMVQDSNKDIPSTLTAMYISFLLLQKNVMKKKYSEETTDAVNTEHIILRLGKLAFRNLESGTLNFYEDDLRKCGINVSEGTVFSGVCTQIFSQQEGVSERNIFSFVHLSVQESLAALYVHHSHCNKKRNVFQRKTLCSQRKWSNKSMTDLHKYAVEKALQSEKGHLDLFLRFLLGLSLEDNQHVLTELLQSLSLNTESVRDTADYIKKKLNDQMSSDRSMNLLHCLSELKDDSLTTEIQKYLNSGDLSTQTLSSTQWSALVYVLMMSEETQETFELKKYRASDEGLRRLLPVVKNTRRALLDHCNLSKDSCESLASVFSSDSPLKELDLSDNDLQDTGVKLLSAGLKSPYCKLEILRFAGCNLTAESMETLVAALQSANSLKELDLTNSQLQDSGVELLSVGMNGSHCKLEILRLAMCKLSELSCDALRSVIQSETSSLKELDLSKNDLQDSGVERLSAGLKSSYCKLETLRLAICKLGKESCDALRSALQTETASLKVLDLSDNDLQDSGVELLSAGLKSSYNKLESLRLALCNLGKISCENLGSVLQLENSSLIELDLSNNDLQDSGVELLSAGLKSSHCKLQILQLALCNLGENTCENLGSVLKLETSSLKELDLSNNDLQDSGVKQLSAGLSSSHCKLQILRLSGCMVTAEGCSSLASALSSNPLRLKELDLTYNQPGESGIKLLTARLEDPHCTLRVDYAGRVRIKKGLKKYACELTLDPNTAHTRLSLSERNTKVMFMRKRELYPDHPERFDFHPQVMCRESLTGRCYWEAEWRVWVAISVTYKRILRKGDVDGFGFNEKSWTLICSDDECIARHITDTCINPPVSKRIGVYLDYQAGTLSFYSISSEIPTRTHLHTFYTTFTDPVYAGFGFQEWDVDCSVHLCEID
ncbi:NACHT, LRR and PYD domains-containing protein 3-like [Salminus brasiliensis]|uniref:NACHT, LRR and PYD domains-containing protein 3-like n=1 Tax=Salminus brasiliensis TaxID=930266 RepID=UPI003B835042